MSILCFYEEHVPFFLAFFWSRSVLVKLSKVSCEHAPQQLVARKGKALSENIIYVYTYTCVYIYIYIHTHVYKHTYIYTHTHTHIYICIYTNVSGTFTSGSCGISRSPARYNNLSTVVFICLISVSPVLCRPLSQISLVLCRFFHRSLLYCVGLFNRSLFEMTCQTHRLKSRLYLHYVSLSCIM